jgi:F-box domain
MDRILPLELLYEICQHLSVKNFLRFRKCSTRTLYLNIVKDVTFNDYKVLTRKHILVFRYRLAVTLKHQHIHRESIKFLIDNLLQLVVVNPNPAMQTCMETDF